LAVALLGAALPNQIRSMSQLSSDICSISACGHLQPPFAEAQHSSVAGQRCRRRQVHGPRQIVAKEANNALRAVKEAPRTASRCEPQEEVNVLHDLKSSVEPRTGPDTSGADNDGRCVRTHPASHQGAERSIRVQYVSFTQSPGRKCKWPVDSLTTLLQILMRPAAGAVFSSEGAEHQGNCLVGIKKSDRGLKVAPGPTIV
jgi:hypothetical protein